MTRILLVEDDNTLAELVQSVLTMHSLEVEWAQNGEVAKKKLETEQYDAIVTDLFMPEMDGATLIKWVRSQGLDLPIVVTSSYADEETGESLKSSGATCVYRKPMSTQDLMDLSQYLLNLE